MKPFCHCRILSYSLFQTPSASPLNLLYPCSLCNLLTFCVLLLHSPTLQGPPGPCFPVSATRFPHSSCSFRLLPIFPLQAHPFQHNSAPAEAFSLLCPHVPLPLFDLALLRDTNFAFFRIVTISPKLLISNSKIQQVWENESYLITLAQNSSKTSLSGNELSFENIYPIYCDYSHIPLQKY